MAGGSPGTAAAPASAQGGTGASNPLAALLGGNATPQQMAQTGLQLMAMGQQGQTPAQQMSPQARATMGGRQMQPQSSMLTQLLASGAGSPTQTPTGTATGAPTQAGAQGAQLTPSILNQLLARQTGLM